jgi:hypothetical protein
MIQPDVYETANSRERFNSNDVLDSLVFAPEEHHVYSFQPVR